MPCHLPLSPSPSPPPSPSSPTALHHYTTFAHLATHIYLRLFGTINPHRLESFVHHVLSHTRPTPTCLFLSLQYLSAFAYAQPKHSSNGSSLTPLFLFTSALSLADSFLNDSPLTLAQYEQASGLSRIKIAKTRTMICETLEWRLAVPEQVFVRWTAFLKTLMRRPHVMHHNKVTRRRASSPAVLRQDRPMSGRKDVEQWARDFVYKGVMRAVGSSDPSENANIMDNCHQDANDVDTVSSIAGVI